MEELKDGGHGITVRSLEYWKQNKDKLGEVTDIICSFDPIKVDTEVTDDGLIIPHGYNLLIMGMKAIMHLSGCNCGYGGEGPNGTRKILEELGIPHNKAVELIHQKRFALGLSDD